MAPGTSTNTIESGSKADPVAVSDPVETETPRCQNIEREPATDQPAFENGWRSWAIIAALSVVALLPAIEGTVVSTALPTIVQNLQGGESYVWVVNAYFLTR